MTFGDYIKCLNQAGVFRLTRNEIAVHLKNAAGLLASDDAVVKWIDRNVPLNIEHYVLEGQVNENEVIKFFRLRTRNTWRTLQKELAQKDHDVINCETGDMEKFYLSLLNQFLVSLGLPLSQMQSKRTNKHIAVALHKYMYPVISNSPLFQSVADEEYKAALSYLDNILKTDIEKSK